MPSTYSYSAVALAVATTLVTVSATNTSDSSDVVIDDPAPSARPSPPPSPSNNIPIYNYVAYIVSGLAVIVAITIGVCYTVKKCSTTDSSNEGGHSHDPHLPTKPIGEVVDMTGIDANFC